MPLFRLVPDEKLACVTPDLTAVSHGVHIIQNGAGKRVSFHVGYQSALSSRHTPVCVIKLVLLGWICPLSACFNSPQWFYMFDEWYLGNRNNIRWTDCLGGGWELCGPRPCQGKPDPRFHLLQWAGHMLMEHSPLHVTRFWPSGFHLQALYWTWMVFKVFVLYSSFIMFFSDSLLSPRSHLKAARNLYWFICSFTPHNLTAEK